MLSAYDIAQLSAASAAAEAEVRRLEAAAEGTGGWDGGLLFPSDAQRAASAAAATLRALLELRNVAIETGNAEQAAEVADRLRNLAEPGRVGHAIERPEGAGLVWHIVPWWGWALGALVVLVLLAPYVTLVGSFIPRRREA